MGHWPTHFHTMDRTDPLICRRPQVVCCASLSQTKKNSHEDTPKDTHADEVPPTPTPAARTHAPRAREPAPQCLEGPPDPAQPAVHHERAYLGCAALRAHLRLSEPP